MHRPRRSTIVLIFAGLMACLVLIAATDLPAPLMGFLLDTGHGSVPQLVICLLAAAAFLKLVHFLLDTVGRYFAHQLDSIQSSATEEQGGEHPQIMAPRSGRGAASK